MPQIKLITGYPAITKAFHIWCDLYTPIRIRYPNRKYLKGEELCKGCAIRRGGILYRASFSCVRERTSKPTYDQLKQMFGWMYGEETKRITKSKVSRKSKKNADDHKSDLRIVIGAAEEKPESTEKRSPASKVEQGEPKPASNPDGLQQLPAEPMWIIAPDVPNAIADIALQEMWIEGDLQSDKRGLGVLPGVSTMTSKMTDEYDNSFEETSVHACITCACGRKVWYGCGAKQESRPKYCRRRTEKVEMRMDSMRERLLATIDESEYNLLVLNATRRYISH